MANTCKCGHLEGWHSQDKFRCEFPTGSKKGCKCEGYESMKEFREKLRTEGLLFKTKQIEAKEDGIRN